MGAMIIGLITGSIAWISFITMNLILATVIFFDARRHKMKPVIWAVMALLFSFYAVPVYIIVRVKIARLKCTSCGAKTAYGNNYCTVCGSPLKKFDDGAVAKKVILGVIIAFAGISIIGALYVEIVSRLNP